MIDEDAPAPRLERAIVRVGERALAPGARGDRELIAALVASTVALKKDQLMRDMGYGGGLAAVGAMAMSWVALPLFGVLGAQWWWHRRYHPSKAPGRLSLFETPDEITQLQAARIRPHVTRIMITARDGRCIALYCDARRTDDVLAAMQRVAPNAQVRVKGMAVP